MNCERLEDIKTEVVLCEACAPKEKYHPDKPFRLSRLGMGECRRCGRRTIYEIFVKRTTTQVDNVE
jgi:hypothetical protein